MSWVSGDCYAGRAGGEAESAADAECFQDGEFEPEQLAARRCRSRPGVVAQRGPVGDRQGACVWAAGRWQVVDITGATADPVGGAAQGTTFPTLPAGARRTDRLLFNRTGLTCVPMPGTRHPRLLGQYPSAAAAIPPAGESTICLKSPDTAAEHNLRVENLPLAWLIFDQPRGKLVVDD